MAAPRSTNPDARRHGLMLVAVMLLVALAALVGATALQLARAGAIEGAAVERRALAGALALSGVQAVMAELTDQRDELILGRDPRLSDGWTVFEDGRRRGVARLRPWPDGALARPEPARLNPNTASIEMLAALPPIGEGLANRIVAERDAQPFASIGDLLRVEGVTIDMVWGDPEDVVEALAPRDPDDPPSFRRSASDAAIGDETPLADVLSVFSFEPNIQSGLTSAGRDHAGKRRINLNRPWSDELGEAITERFDEFAAESVQNLMSDDVSFASMADVVRVLNSFNVPVEDWPDILDAFTATDDPYLIGRVDVNRAPRGVIASLPGLTDEDVDRIMDLRESLSDEQRATPAWPVVEEAVAPPAFEAIADHVAVRSLQWRVRVEAGLERQDDQDGARTGDLGEIELTGRVVYEAVIDLAAPRPRIAYLRDITMLPAAARFLSMRADAADADDDRARASLVDDALGDPIASADLADPFDPRVDPDPFMDAGDLGDPAGTGALNGPGDPFAAPPPGSAGGAGPGALDAGSEPKDNRIGRWIVP